MLYNIVDRIYIGHIPGIGAAALTGVGVCMPLIMIVSAFAALVGYGGAPRASIFMGKQDKESAEKTLGNCFAVQILISVILTAVLLIWNRDFLMAFGASENTIEYGVSYMNIYALGTVFVELTLGMNALYHRTGIREDRNAFCSHRRGGQYHPGSCLYFRIQHGCARRSAGNHYFPGSFLCLGDQFSLRKKNVPEDKAKKYAARAESHSSLPCAGNRHFYHAGQRKRDLCLLQQFSSEIRRDLAVGAMTILTSVMQFAMLPLQGLGQGAQPIISYNYGAGDAGRVKAAFKLLLKVSLGYATLLWFLVMVLPGGFAAMFTSDGELMELRRPLSAFIWGQCS